MGCDIHWLVEGQRKDTLAWEQPAFDKLIQYEGNDDAEIESQFDVRNHDRNYALFFLLAGVRYWRDELGPDPMPLFPSRGLPADSTRKPDDDTVPWLGDHSHTWFDKDDWNSVSRENKDLLKKIAPEVVHALDGLLFYDRFKSSLYKRYRVLVGFDS